VNPKYLHEYELWEREKYTPSSAALTTGEPYRIVLGKFIRLYRNRSWENMVAFQLKLALNPHKDESTDVWKVEKEYQIRTVNRRRSTK
jgi:hypothetical protein